MWCSPAVQKVEDRQKESSRWTRRHWQTPLTRILVKKDGDDGYNDGNDGEDGGDDGDDGVLLINWMILLSVVHSTPKN